MIENGKRRPSAIVLKKLANIYGVQYIDLYEKAGYINLDDAMQILLERLKERNL